MTEQPPDLDDGPVDPYADLGGLTRPTSYFGAIEFRCDTEDGGCGVLAGDKCRLWVERTQLWETRKMPCLSRLRKAHAAGYI
jgi:hypothetical protein